MFGTAFFGYRYFGAAYWSSGEGAELAGMQSVFRHWMGGAGMIVAVAVPDGIAASAAVIGSIALGRIDV